KSLLPGAREPDRRRPSGHRTARAGSDGGQPDPRPPGAEALRRWSRRGSVGTGDRCGRGRGYWPRGGRCGRGRPRARPLPPQPPSPPTLSPAPARPQHPAGRVPLPLPDCTTHPSDCADIHVLNTLDGFNLQPRLSIPFDGPIDVHTVTSNTVFLISLGDT